MKRIIFYKLKKDNARDIFWETHKNSYFSLKQNKVIFNNKEEIRVFYSNLNLNQKLADDLVAMYDKVKEDASQLSNEPIQEKSDTFEWVKGTIENTINHFSYFEDSSSIFELVTEIFIKLLMFHPFQNGNKRFALSFLIYLLRFLGYHFNWSKGTKKNYKIHENKIEEFVKQLNRNNVDNHLNYEASKMNVLKWIQENCVIAIKFV